MIMQSRNTALLLVTLLCRSLTASAFVAPMVHRQTSVLHSSYFSSLGGEGELGKTPQNGEGNDASKDFFARRADEDRTVRIFTV